MILPIGSINFQINMAAEISIVSEVLLGGSFSFHVFEEDKNDLPMFSVAAAFAKLNLVPSSSFEQTLSFYFVDEFESHLRLRRTMFQV